MVTYLGSLVQLCCGEGGTLQTSLACVRSARSVWTTLILPQLTAACAFRVYTAQAPGCSAGVLSKADPVFHALPRSKSLRFRFLSLHKGTDWVGPEFCALSRSKQLRRPGAWGAHSPQVGGLSYHLPTPAAQFPGCTAGVLNIMCK